jgi:hypothetical protein
MFAITKEEIIQVLKRWDNDENWNSFKYKKDDWR